MSSSVLCFGELLLRLGAPGQQLLLQTPSLDVHVGGAEANVGVALACLGHDVAMAGVVADNALGSAALGELRRHGVDTRHVRRNAGRMGLYFMTAGAGLRPGEVVYDRAESAFAAAPADSCCSHSGIFTCGAARLITAITTGARARRLRSNAS